MKGSDSTNSLTELTGKDECFICLMSENANDEPLVSSKLLRACGCKFFVHPSCWNVWLKGKTDWDCPICRKQSVLRISIPPNPVLNVEIPREFEARRKPKLAVCMAMVLLIFAIAMIFSLVKGD